MASKPGEGKGVWKNFPARKPLTLFSSHASGTTEGQPRSRFEFLKHESESKLDDPGTGTEGQNLPELGTADVGDGIISIGVVQEIEDIRSELYGF